MQFHEFQFFVDKLYNINEISISKIFNYSQFVFQLYKIKKVAFYKTTFYSMF